MIGVHQPVRAAPATDGRRLLLSPRMLLAAVVLLGAAMRFSGLRHVGHSYDDSYPAYDATRLLDRHQWVLVGQPSSVSLDNPPLMGYLQAIPLLLWRSPWAVYLFVVSLNTLAIWFVYRAGRELLGERAGLLAAFLFAINPWVVFFSRNTWVQALLPLLTAVAAWGLWPALAGQRRSPRPVLAGFLALAAMILTYVQAWGALAQVGPLLALFRRRCPRRALWAGALVLLLSLGFYGLAVSQDLQRVRSRLERFSHGRPRVTREALDHAVRLVSGLDFESVYARTPSAGYQRQHALSRAANALLALALAAGVGRAAWELRRPGLGRRVAAILLTWFAVPVLLMSASTHVVHPHYLLLTLPAGHLLAAWGMAPVFGRAWPRRPAALLLVAIAAVFALNLHRAADVKAAKPGGPRLGDWALAEAARLGAGVRSLAARTGDPPRVAADARPALLSSLSATYVTVLPNLRYPDYTVLPGERPLLYVLAGKAALGAPPGRRWQPFPELGFTLADGTRVSFVYALPCSREAALAQPRVKVDWPTAEGLTLLGYSLDSGTVRPGEAISCTTYWRVDTLQRGRAEWYLGASYRLLDPDGDVRANVGGHGQWGYNWRLGDVYVERMAIPVPGDARPGGYKLEIALRDTVQGRGCLLRAPTGPSGALAVGLRVEGELARQTLPLAATPELPRPLVASATAGKGRPDAPLLAPRAPQRPQWERRGVGG